MSPDFILQTIIRVIVIEIVLIGIFYILKRNVKNDKVKKCPFVLFIFISSLFIVLINFLFVLNAKVQYTSLLASIEKEDSIKVFNSTLSPETKGWIEEEISISQETKLLIIKLLAEQEYILQPYGTSLATRDYLLIELVDENRVIGHIQAIGTDFVAFKYGFFKYRAIAGNEQLLEGIRDILVNKTSDDRP